MWYLGNITEILKALFLDSVTLQTGRGCLKREQIMKTKNTRELLSEMIRWRDHYLAWAQSGNLGADLENAYKEQADALSAAITAFETKGLCQGMRLNPAD